MKNIYKILCLTAIAFLSISTLKAQVKIGKNPTVITSTSALEIEALKGKKVVVTKDSGRVGINTTAPRELLDVFGNIRAGGWGKGSVSIGPGPYGSDGASIIFNPYVRPTTGQFNSDSLDILGNNPRSFISDAGNVLQYSTQPFGISHHAFEGGLVGMGIFNFVPSARLHVQGIYYTADAPIDIIKAEIYDNGNVGSSNSRNIVLSNLDSTINRFAVIAFTPSSLNSKSGAEINGVERSVAKLSAGLAFSTRANATGATLTERMRISANGNVGIGTTAPSQALDVIGNVKATGANGGSAMLASTDNSTRTGNVGFYAPNGTRLGYIGNADSTSIRYISEQNRDHFFGGGLVAMGGFTQFGEGFKALARLHVSAGYLGGTTIDISKFEINNCGAACAQETARNIVLTNGNYTNPKFATIVFAPSAGDTKSGSEIAGVDRSAVNFSSGISFSTRDNVAGATLNERLRISANGHVGIGHQNPAYDLHLGNGAYVSNAGVWTNASDARLKTNIVPTIYGLKEVMALRPVHYNMKKGGEAQEGFIAQEVRKVIPEVVSGKEGDLSKGETLGLSYGNLVPILTKAIQEQQAHIEALEAENATYKAFMQEMKTEITSLKEQFGIKSEENQKSKK